MLLIATLAILYLNIRFKPKFESKEAEEIANLNAEARKFPNRLTGLRKASGILPVAGAAVGFSIAGSQAMAGDIKGAQVTALETGLGEIPVVGDIFTADPAAGGTLEAASATQRAVEERRLNPTAADKFFRDPLNELEYAGKQLIGGLKTVGGAILFGF